MDNLKARIRTFLKTYGKSPTWLAERAGVGPYSLTRYLGKKESDLVHGNWVRLQQAMDDYERVMARPKDAA